MKWLTTLMMATVLFTTVQAQVQTAKGTVTDAKDGTPLQGVSVKVKGQAAGTQTDEAGNFTINMPPGSKVLVFSFIGYEIIEAEATANMQIKLGTQTQDLNAVVVVGYGTKTKKDVTGAIAKLNQNDYIPAPVQSFEQAIQGKAAGVVISSGSGKVGQGIKVQVRGSASLSAGTQPFYVIDGVPMISNSQSDINNDPTNPLADLNPSDIQSIEILKDASAAAIYGSRAANGVVLITTKKGRAGKTNIEANYAVSFSKPTKKRGFLTGKEYSDLLLEAAKNDGVYDFQNGISGFGSEQEAIDFFTNDPDYGAVPVLDYLAQGTDWRNNAVNTPWEDYIYRNNAIAHQADISVSGGDEKTRFYASGTFSDQQAIVIMNKFQKYGGRLNLDHTASKRLTLGMNLAINRSENFRVSDDNAFSTPGQIVALAPIAPLRDANGEYSDNIPYYNGLIQAGNASDRQRVFRNIGNVYATYKLLPSLAFRSEFGADILNQNEEQFQNNKTQDGAPAGKGQYLTASITTFNTNNYLTFTPTFKGDHDLELVGGMSYQQINSRISGIQGENFPSQKLQTLSSAGNITFGSSSGTTDRFLSYFTRASYKFKDRYLLSLSGRIDGSSRFGNNRRYGFFPAASVGWVLSDEEFLKPVTWVSSLKLRAGYGITGNAEIGNLNYLSLFSTTQYPNLPGFEATQVANPDLGWEKTGQVNIGLDFGLFNNRLSATIDWYKKHTTDLLLTVQIPSTSGFTSVVRNVGVVDNSGVEFTISSRNFAGKDFQWTTDFVAAYNKNNVVDINGQIIDDAARAGRKAAIEGNPIASFYMPVFAGVDPNNGDALYLDAEGKTTSDYSLANRRVVGNPNPKWTGGLTNTFTYKGLSLSAFFSFTSGNDIFNASGVYQETGFGNGYDNQTRTLLNRWQKPGDITNVPRVGVYYNNGYFESTRWLYDGSFIRLKSLMLSYNLPKNLLGKANISGLRLFVAGYNLFTITSYAYDPEVNSGAGTAALSGGIDYYTIPTQRSITVGLNVKL
ncbi:SusC/RagA family TonB-linked outer membrane protein [Foetidibacter luteolus]|uniref:SusC/RagA family TonB-linked outer membrane protein n=1 Tax=Foetidibacter luteolus TaxID=2608880 RepID=UPI00129BF2F8|nr:TonB-dependent receptor [Foetidibacter luteolus]